MKKPLSIPRTPDDVYVDDGIEVKAHLGPGHRSVRPVEITAAKFEAAVKVALNGAAVVYSD